MPLAPFHPTIQRWFADPFGEPTEPERQGQGLRDGTGGLDGSPRRALGNDVQKNLQPPLDALAQRDRRLPEMRGLVRTGDTSPRDRAAMLRKPPHILVTTPESLYIIL